MRGDRFDECIDLGDRLLHGTSEDFLTKSIWRFAARIDSFVLKGVEEECKCPFRVCATINADVPFVGQGICERALDVFPAADVAIVHPHERVVLEGVAVVFGERAFGRGADVSEDQSRTCFWRDPLEIDAVPSWES